MIMQDDSLKYRFLKQALPESSKKRIVVITGARQTGKTTLARHIYPELSYINLDAPENREILDDTSSALWAKSVGVSVIDEAQKLPDIFEKVKYAFDEGGIHFTVLTGSSQILLLKKVRESMAGRAFFYELWPLLQSELTGADTSEKARKPLIHGILSGHSIEAVLNDQVPRLMEKDDAHYRLAEEHILNWGGMPGLLPLSVEERWNWLRNYGYTYLERDLGDLARIEDLSPFRKFQRLSAFRSAKLLNYSDLARDAGISVDTARRYFEYLNLSYQTFCLPPYYRNLTSAVIKTPKLYWVDIGILRQLTGFKGKMTGDLYETMVVSEIYKWIKTFQLDADLFFYRTRAGMELDLLIETTAGIMGMEIKSRQKIYKKDLRAMKDVAVQLGGRWLGGIVAYQGNEIKKMDQPGIWCVPSRRLFQ